MKRILKHIEKTHSISFLRGGLMRLSLVSCLLSLISYLPAQVTATFKGDSAKIEIGDHLNMRLVVNAQPDYLIDFPTFLGDSIGKIDIIKKDKIDMAKLGGNIIYSQNLVISAYDEGRYFFNPMKIYILNKKTNVLDSIYTNDWMLTVTTLPVDTNKPIKAIKAPLKVPYQLNEFTWWIAAAVLILLAIIIGLLIYNKYRKKPKIVQARPRPKEPAHIWAANELKKLDNDKLWQKDEVKLYYSRLSDILRSYLEYRYNYYALEATTEEILKEVNRFDVGMEASGLLMNILGLADFVKFAKMNPAPDQNMKSIQDALAFVERTRPKLEELNDNKQIKK